MFDLTGISESDFDLIPNKTKVNAVVTSAEWKTSKAGDDYLNTEMTVFDGQFEGRKLWNMLHLNNKNEVAKNIALSQLKTLIAGTGEAKEQLSKDEVIPAIMESRVEITVGIKDGGSLYSDSNEVKKMKAWNAEKSNNVGF